jgi:hypothetical protein
MYHIIHKLFYNISEYSIYSKFHFYDWFNLNSYIFINIFNNQCTVLK